MIVTPTLVRDAKVEQWHKQEMQFVQIVQQVCIRLKQAKEHVIHARLVDGVIKSVVYRRQTASDADKVPTQPLQHHHP